MGAEWHPDGADESDCDALLYFSIFVSFPMREFKLKLLFKKT